MLLTSRLEDATYFFYSQNIINNNKKKRMGGDGERWEDMGGYIICIGRRRPLASLTCLEVR